MAVICYNNKQKKRLQNELKALKNGTSNSVTASVEASVRDRRESTSKNNVTTDAKQEHGSVTPFTDQKNYNFSNHDV